MLITFKYVPLILSPKLQTNMFNCLLLILISISNLTFPKEEALISAALIFLIRVNNSP